MTQEDSVQRLAEIRAAYERADDFTRARMDNVKWMLDLIDSLTAERDRLAAAGCPRCGHALRNEQDHALGSPCPMCGCMSTGGSDGAEAWRIRAEAAEADRERLREGANTVMLALKTGAYMDGFNGPDGFSSAEDAIEWAIVELAALATPPSEGGES